MKIKKIIMVSVLILSFCYGGLLYNRDYQPNTNAEQYGEITPRNSDSPMQDVIHIENNGQMQSHFNDQFFEGRDGTELSKCFYLENGEISTIEMYDCSLYLNITNVTFTDSITLNHTSNIIFTNCTFSSLKDSNEFLIKQNTLSEKSSNIIISNSTFSYSSIDLRGVDNIEIYDCKFYSESIGLNINGSNTNCEIYSLEFYDITLAIRTSSSIDIRECYFDNECNIGISLISNNLIVEDNEILSTDGILMNFASNVVVRNNLLNNSVYSIKGTDGSNQFYNNSIFGNIEATIDSSTISNNYYDDYSGSNYHNGTHYFDSYSPNGILTDKLCYVNYQRIYENQATEISSINEIEFQCEADEDISINWTISDFTINNSFDYVIKKDNVIVNISTISTNELNETKIYYVFKAIEGIYTFTLDSTDNIGVSNISKTIETTIFITTNNGDGTGDTDGTDGTDGTGDTDGTDGGITNPTTTDDGGKKLSIYLGIGSGFLGIVYYIYKIYNDRKEGKQAKSTTENDDGWE